MPLTKRQFELGVDAEAEEWMRQVYALLERQQESAFSVEELQQTLLGDSRDIAREEKFGAALRALVEVQAVKQGFVKDQQYYAHGQEVDTTTWKPKSTRPEIQRFG